MKEYDKKYEDYPILEYNWRSGKRIKCDIKKVSNRRELDVDQYILRIKEAAWDLEKEFFSKAVKLLWLIDQFGYKDKFRSRVAVKKDSPGRIFEAALASFLQYYVGMDNRLFSQSEPMSIIRSYLNDWFPNIRHDNLFESDIKYPYKYMNLGCAAFVHRMPERMELLKIGEERKMMFNDFVNYVVNYIFCYNEEHGETYFIYSPPKKNKFPFIRLVKKYE